MKKIILIIFSSFPLISLGAPCRGAPGKNHVNSNGAVGGFVANTAKVSSSILVEAGSVVCDRAIIQGTTKLRGTSVVGGSASIEGNVTVTGSRVSGQAKVFGAAVITNSSICQASQINFNVINSDYYCQTDDPEPSHPGELGKKTLLGIDSDVDGVRDDIEIWINSRTSNSLDKNMYNHRMALKQISKNMQLNLRYKDNIAESKRYKLATLNAYDCLKSLSSPEDFELLSGEIQYETFSTLDRIKADFKTRSVISGVSLGINQNKRELCDFKVK